MWPCIMHLGRFRPMQTSGTGKCHDLCAQRDNGWPRCPACQGSMWPPNRLLQRLWGGPSRGMVVGPELKWSGYDAVVIYGKSSRPVYLWIHDGGCGNSGCITSLGYSDRRMHRKDSRGNTGTSGFAWLPSGLPVKTWSGLHVWWIRVGIRLGVADSEP